ncbi:RNA polymerase sigma factor [Streptomyces mirabilis]|uniref:RNA polymerase sigma factor n=1 Tax=Streptomyces mirabilis TaxID=68239 RepID=UPI003674DDDE
MQVDGAGDMSAAAQAGNLQPAGDPMAARSPLDAPVLAPKLHTVDDRQTEKAQQVQEGIDRRTADGRMVELLAKDNFTGPRYERFQEELVRYGISVLRGWMHSGYIFELVAQRGFSLNPHELDLEDLTTDSELRQELATMTIARALPRFRQHAFIDGGWSVEGGASLTTYFMGACAYCFPNEWRRHCTAEARHRRAVRREKELYEPPVSTYTVAQEVLSNLSVLDELDEIEDPRQRAVVALTLDGYSQDEIREIVGMPTVRAVEGLLYRWRAKAKKNRMEERDARA